MALANVASLLAEDQSHPQKVLLVDLDLEAPGLHRLFPPADGGRPFGIVDIAYDFSLDEESDIKLDEYIYRTHLPNLDVLPAGHVSTDYCSKLQSIYWPSFLTEDPTERGRFFDQLVSKINQKSYDYVLIDSRTGLNDQAGIATQILPELIVMVFRLTEQNLEGLQHLVTTTKQQLEMRNRGGVEVFPLASFVTSGSSDHIDQVRSSFSQLFETTTLEYVRFDPNLVSQERILSKKEFGSIWPTPPIVEDYKRLCATLRRKNINDSKTGTRDFQTKLKHGDNIGAVKLLSTLLRNSPKNPRLWDLVYDSSFRIRRSWGVIDTVANEMIESDSTNPFPYEWIASKIAIEYDGQDEAAGQALVALDNAITFGGVAERLHAKKSEVYEIAGELDVALSELRHAIELNPESVNLKLRFAALCLRRGRDYFVSALDILEEINSPEKLPLKILILAFFRAEETQEQISLFDTEFNLLLEAHRLVLYGEIERSIALVEEHMDHFDDSDELLNVAEFYLCAEQFEKCEQLLEQIGQESHPLGLLSKYVQSRGESPSSEEVVNAWTQLDSWRFIELLLFRERLIRDHGDQYKEVLPVFKQIISSNLRTRNVGKNSLYFRRPNLRRRISRTNLF